MVTIVLTKTFIIKGENEDQALEEFKECENEMDYFHQEEYVVIENTK